MKSLVQASTRCSLALGDLKAEARLCYLNTLPRSPCRFEASPGPLPSRRRGRWCRLSVRCCQVAVRKNTRRCWERRFVNHERCLASSRCWENQRRVRAAQSPAHIGRPCPQGGSRACRAGAVPWKEALEPTGAAHAGAATYIWGPDLNPGPDFGASPPPCLSGSPLVN